MRTYGRQPRVGAVTPGFAGYSCTVVGNTFTTTDGAPGAPWSGGATATNPFTTCVVQATVGSQGSDYMTIGLNQSPFVPMGADYTGWDYGLLSHIELGHYAIILNGGYYFYNVTPQAGDVMTVAYNGTQCTYLVNGLVVGTENALNIGAPVYPAWGCASLGGTTTLTLDPVAPGVGYEWVTIETDSNGNNDEVYFTTLCQTLGLNLNESPFYSTYGIPAEQAVQQQVSPDVYVAQTQQAFAQYFRSLTITKTSSRPPTYRVVAVTHTGVLLTGYSPPPF